MSQSKTTVLILGAGGMLGNTLFRCFFADSRYDVFGTLRTSGKMRFFTAQEHDRIIPNIDVQSECDLNDLFSTIKPNVVINCVGIIKQLKASESHLESLAINAMLPHRLLQYCRLVNARLVHLSTDCVFSGKDGNYIESDFPDANDLYGRTKYLGEVNTTDSITLRTSIIGHELASEHSLIDWFLSQEGTVRGFGNAIFSGFPTIEIARIVRDKVLPNPELSGLYHLSAAPINKFDLLSLVAEIYGKNINITMDRTLSIDRSLKSDRFQMDAEFSPMPWRDLIKAMHKDFQILSQRRQ